MTYLLSIYQPDGPPPPAADLARIMRDVRALRDEMAAAGVLVFTGGLHDPTAAVVLRFAAGDVSATDGPYVESKEHLGGLTLVRAASAEAAREWGRKLARATTLPVEVRAFRDG